MPRSVKPLDIPRGESIPIGIAFALVLREKRDELDLSQGDFWDGQKYDQAYISLVENGKRQPGLLAIVRIAEVLQMTPGKLLDEVMKRAGKK